jgi:hypothetical protein
MGTGRPIDPDRKARYRPNAGTDPPSPAIGSQGEGGSIMDRSRLGRGLAILAVAALAVAVVSPAFSAAPLTKSKVKKIAKKQALAVLASEGALNGSRWVVEEFTAPTPNFSHEATVNCPSGTRLVTGGVDSPGGLEALWLNESGPVINGSNLGTTGPGTYSAATGWHVQVFNDESTPLVYRVGVLCAKPAP